MTATGTIRTFAENQLIEAISALDGFTDTPSDTDWLVSGPPDGEPKSRRWVVIGTYDGSLDPNGIEAGAGPSIDEWTITCGAACTDVADAQTGKQACEDVINAIADMLAADHRVGAGSSGLRDVTVARIDGPYSEQVSGKPRLSWINFDITARADIRRNQT